MDALVTITSYNYNSSIDVILDDIRLSRVPYLVFCDLDGVILSEETKTRFRNQNDNMIYSFKNILQHDMCSGFYILTYRGNSVDAVSNVVDQLHNIGLRDVLDKHDNYMRHLPDALYKFRNNIISLDCCTSKAYVINKAASSKAALHYIKRIFFIDNTAVNIIGSAILYKGNMLLDLVYFADRDSQINKNRFIKSNDFNIVISQHANK